MTQKVAASDTVLVLSIMFLLGDLFCEWDNFAECPKPIHMWLSVSYGLLVTSRIIVLGCSFCSATEAGHLLINLRQKSTALQMAMSAMWMVILPLFAAWSVCGTFWTYEVMTVAPHCMPSTMHTWFLLVWQVMSYAWILIYGGLGVVAWVLEMRLRRTEGNLRQIEDPEVVARWGRVSILDGYTSLPTTMACAGLTPGQILSLPGKDVDLQEDGRLDEDCPICLHALRSDSSVRELRTCGHVFHRACVDLWLLRSAECPLCKVQVSVAAAAAAAANGMHG